MSSGSEYDSFTFLPLKILENSCRYENKTVTIAVCNPSDLHPMDEIKFFLKGHSVKFVLAPEPEILRIIHAHFDKTASDAKDMMEEMVDGELSEFSDLESDALDLTNEAPIIKMVNVILSQAVTERASDIHIESYEKTVTVRYRVDGILHKVLSPPKSYQAGIISRIKIMSNLNIAENRLPQDGRIKLKSSGKEIDFRVNTLPTLFGEKVVLRMLSQGNLQLDLTKLGFEQKQLEVFKKGIYAPNGMVLVTGPTGSGKTTTLYSALSELNQVTDNISTAEDPVEYNLEGVNQVQVNKEIGLSFANVLRSLLRQDPDTILVGEIRDYETAEVAVQAALTGHLVLSTLHTNDFSTASERLCALRLVSSASPRAVLPALIIRCSHASNAARRFSASAVMSRPICAACEKLPLTNAAACAAIPPISTAMPWMTNATLPPITISARSVSVRMLNGP
jgi:general secretion pathway protein E